MAFPDFDPVQVFRDFVTDKIPSSGKWNPRKSDIRRLLKSYESAILALIAGQGGDIELARGVISFAVTGGTANDIVAEPDSELPDNPGSAVYILGGVEQSNTGNVTINGKPLLTNSGGQIASGGLVADGIYLFLDDGASYRLVSDQASAAIVAAAEAAAVEAEDAAGRAEAAAAGVEYPVSYGLPQSLAALQRLQALANIGAVSFEDGQSLSAAQSLQAQANIGPVNFDTVADLLADTILDYTPASGRVAVPVGKQIDAQGHRYTVAASDAADYHVQMAGGPRLYVGREAGGIYSTSAFGVKGNGIDDDTIPMQKCLNAAGQYGIVIVDRAAKSIRVTDTLVVPNALTIMSYCHSVSTPSPREDAPIIWLDNPAGGKPLFEGGAGGVQLNDVWLMGVNPSIPLGTVAMPAGSTAVKSLGVVKTNGLTVMQFDAGVETTGGYYHKHDGIFVRNCKTIFKNAGAYNFHVSQGRFNDFDHGFVSTGGSGPVSFTQCSFEKWTTGLFNHPSSGRQKVSLDHCYVENYPGMTAAAGLSTSNSPNYDRALGFTGGLSLSIRDSNIQLKGVRRWVNNVGATEKITVSDGNTYWLYAPGSGSQIENTEILFQLSNNKVFITNDLFMFVNPDGSFVDFTSWTGATTYKNGNVNLTGTWDWFGFDFVRHIGPLPATATGLKAGTMYNNAGTVSVAP